MEEAVTIVQKDDNHLERVIADLGTTNIVNSHNELLDEPQLKKIRLVSPLEQQLLLYKEVSIATLPILNPSNNDVAIHPTTTPMQTQQVGKHGSYFNLFNA